MQFRMKENTRADFLLVVTLFLPVFWEQLASIVLSVITSAISSNIDTVYLSAVSLVGNVTGPLTMLYVSIATGASILMSHYIGAEDDGKARKLFATSNVIGLLISFAIAIIVILFRDPILRSLYPNMSESFLENSSIYSVFLALTIPLTFFRTNVIGILRSCLNTKGPLYISLYGGIVNIVLQFLFMVVFKWGIWGLGISTLLSSIFFAAVTFAILYKAGTFKGCVKNTFKLFSFEEAINTVKIGGVMCIRSFITATASLILTQILAKMGDFETAIFTIAQSATALFTLAPTAMAHVTQILTGKYKGAGDELRSYKINFTLTAVTTAFTVILALIMYPLAEVIVKIYNSDPLTVEHSAKVFRIYLLCTALFWSGGNVFLAGLRGVGQVKYPAFVLCFASWAYLIPGTWYACSVLGYGADGRMLVFAMEQALYSAFFVTYGIIRYRKLKKEAVKSQVIKE